MQLHENNGEQPKACEYVVCCEQPKACECWVAAVAALEQRRRSGEVFCSSQKPLAHCVDGYRNHANDSRLGIGWYYRLGDFYNSLSCTIRSKREPTFGCETDVGTYHHLSYSSHD
jgi:hypothetical protein